METKVRACAFDTRFAHRPQRPLLRYYGGKFRNADRIIRHFPSRYRIYVEPFGGGGSVLLKKPRSFAEIYNDLDQDVVNLFQVMRDPARAACLIERVRWTPFARDEFCLAYQDADEPIEQARRTLVRSFMGYGSSATSRRERTGFRSSPYRQWSNHADDWKALPDALAPIVERLRGVIVENRDAFRVIAQYDSPETLFYIDPPYLPSARASARQHYRHDLSEAEHVALAQTLHQVQGYVVLSGYDSALYSQLYVGWPRIEWRDYAMGARPRLEVLWLSPNVAEADLFSMAHEGARS